MTPFNRPRPGETIAEQDERKEAMVRFMLDKHHWPRSRAMQVLEDLDDVGLAYVGVEMRQAVRTASVIDYEPFKAAFEVI